MTIGGSLVLGKQVPGEQNGLAAALGIEPVACARVVGTDEDLHRAIGPGSVAWEWSVQHRVVVAEFGRLNHQLWR